MNNEDNGKILEEGSKHIPNKAKTICVAAISANAKEQHVIYSSYSKQAGKHLSRRCIYNDAAVTQLASIILKKFERR